MIKQIGTKIYYCLLTGNVIKIIGDCQGYVRETTFDEDYEIYSELKEREKSSIGLLQFEYGEYPKLSQGSAGVMVNLETKELIFSYDKLPPIPSEANEFELLKNKVSVLEDESIINMLAITEMYELNSLERTVKEVPAHIQATYQKLYELGLKEISEMPFEVRINLKAK